MYFNDRSNIDVQEIKSVFKEIFYNLPGGEDHYNFMNPS